MRPVAVNFVLSDSALELRRDVDRNTNRQDPVLVEVILSPADIGCQRIVPGRTIG